MPPNWSRAQTDEFNSDLIGYITHLAEVLVYLVTGLVDCLERRPRKFKLPPWLKADIRAIFGQADYVRALHHGRPAKLIAQPLKHRFD